MKNTLLKRSLSFLIAFCLLSPIFTTRTTATSFIENQEEVNLSELPTWADVYAGIADPKDMFDPIDATHVPEAVGHEIALERGHIQRLYEQEPDLNTILFLNADGTTTMYSFDYPVKYITENGNVQDISLEISNSVLANTSYQSSAGNAITQFSTYPANGIKLSDDDTNITLIPILPTQNSIYQTTTNQISETSQVTLVNEKTVSYYYDNKTSIEYSLTYTGFKEDIVVSQYTGQTEYSFKLQTSGLTLWEKDGSYYLINDADEIKATLGDIIIFTADEKNNTFGTMSAVTVKEKQEYILTIHVDEEYLRNPNTKYPIRIDPTIEINYSNNGAGAIEDVTINQLTDSAGSSGSLYIGCRNTYGITRILMRFPYLNLSSISSAANISDASLHMRDLMCQSESMTVECYVFNGNVWSESTAEWANVSPNSISTFLSSNDISYANGLVQSNEHWFIFNIAEAVRGWKLGNYDQAKGIIFKPTSAVENAGPHISKTFGSYNRAEYKPFLTITYSNDNSPSFSEGTYYVNNRRSGNYLYFTGTGITGLSGLISNLGAATHWQILSTDTGFVIRSATNTSMYLGVPIDTTSSAVEIVTVSGSSIPNRCKWNILVASGGGAIIQSTHNSRYLQKLATISTATSTGSAEDPFYDAFVWRMASTTNYGNTADYIWRELDSQFGVKDLVVDIRNSRSPSIIKSPSTAMWVKASDFSYSLVDEACCIINEDKITGILYGYTTVMATHKVTNLSTTFKVYVDHYFWKLITEFGFSKSEALMVREFYDRVKSTYLYESNSQIAWRYTRLLGGFVYNDGTIGQFKWNDVAGSAITGGVSEEQYFVNTLGMTSTAYSTLKSAVKNQHNVANAGNAENDFAHCMITLSSRLSYKLDKDGIFSNIFYGDDENVSFLAGWLGDATLKGSNNLTSFGNDDYHADLDAENIYQKIISGYSFTEAANEYYDQLSPLTTRADIFLTHIEYSTVQSLVFEELYHTNTVSMETLKTDYPDTYNFLMSLSHGDSSIVNYAS